MQISQMMTSYIQPDFVQIQVYDEKRYLSQFVSEMFDFLQQGSVEYAPQYELKSSITMATHWVPDLRHIKSFLATFGVPF